MPARPGFTASGSRMRCRSVAALLTFVVLVACASCQSMDPASTLECHRRLYTYKVSKTDADGHQCWDMINVMSCWGRCDSNEISDWRFPYKRSFHPVCLHDARERRLVRLRNCDEGAAPGTERYEFLEAVSCRCSVCRSSEASCEGLRYRGQRSGPFGGKMGGGGGR